MINTKFPLLGDRVGSVWYMDTVSHTQILEGKLELHV